MDEFREEFIKGLLETLKIPATAFNIAIAEDEIACITNDNLREFYKEVLIAETYGNGMKAILQTAESYKPQSKLSLKLLNSRSEAKEMYNKFYSQCTGMMDFTRANRNKYPNDKKFFENMNYAELKQSDDTKTYSKRELYVLEQLGGGKWLMNIKLADNSKVVIDKIQRVIDDAIVTKYSDVEKLSSRKVMKMLERVA